VNTIQLRQYEAVQEQIQRSLWQIDVETARIKELLEEAEKQLADISQNWSNQGEDVVCPNCALPPESHGPGYVCCLVYDPQIGWFEPTESVK
jgi:rubredoxin